MNYDTSGWCPRLTTCHRVPSSVLHCRAAVMRHCTRNARIPKDVVHTCFHSYVVCTARRRIENDDKKSRGARAPARKDDLNQVVLVLAAHVLL